MKLKKIIGAILVASPFVAVGWFMVLDSCWLDMLIVVGLTVLVVGVLAVGIYLLDS